MTNIKFTKKSRHPRRNNGGVSSGKKENQEIKLFANDSNSIFFTGVKKSDENDKKWNEINYK